MTISSSGMGDQNMHVGMTWTLPGRGRLHIIVGSFLVSAVFMLCIYVFIYVCMLLHKM